MYALLILPLIPLYGWWLYRKTRSFVHLAAVVNEHDVNLGFLDWNSKTHAMLLFSDVRFVFWLLREKYRNIELPPPVTAALDEARRDYLSGLWQNFVILVLVLLIAQA